MTNISPRRSRQRQNDDEEDETGCCHDTVRSAVRGLHIIDGVMGLLFLLYGLALSAASTPARTAVVLTLLTATLLLSRAILGGMALTTATCQRCGLLISAYCSALLVLLYFVLGFVCLGLHTELFQYLRNHKLYLPSGLLDFLEAHVQAICTIMMVLALIELFRWGLLQRYRRRLYEEDAADRSGLEDPLLSPSRGVGDPPRWSHFHNYDRTIDVHEDFDLQRGTRVKKRRFDWLSNLFRRRENDSDIRSTGDFASVNEEWTTRSEDDPLWWSREEEDVVIRDEEGSDTSWAEEGASTPAKDEEKKTQNEQDAED